jgi:hypothetical protein
MRRSWCRRPKAEAHLGFLSGSGSVLRAQMIWLYLCDGCPDGGHDLFDRLPLVAPPGQVSTGELDEPLPGGSW